MRNNFSTDFFLYVIYFISFCSYVFIIASLDIPAECMESEKSLASKPSRFSKPSLAEIIPSPSSTSNKTIIGRNVRSIPLIEDAPLLSSALIARENSTRNENTELSTTVALSPATVALSPATVVEDQHNAIINTIKFCREYSSKDFNIDQNTFESCLQQYKETAAILGDDFYLEIITLGLNNVSATGFLDDSEVCYTTITKLKNSLIHYLAYNPEKHFEEHIYTIKTLDHNMNNKRVKAFPFLEKPSNVEKLKQELPALFKKEPENTIPTEAMSTVIADLNALQERQIVDVAPIIQPLAEQAAPLTTSVFVAAGGNGVINANPVNMPIELDNSLLSHTGQQIALLRLEGELSARDTQNIIEYQKSSIIGRIRNASVKQKLGLIMGLGLSSMIFLDKAFSVKLIPALLKTAISPFNPNMGLPQTLARLEPVVNTITVSTNSGGANIDPTQKELLWALLGVGAGTVWAKMSRLIHILSRI